jgi:hypothetical protein
MSQTIKEMFNEMMMDDTGGFVSSIRTNGVDYKVEPQTLNNYQRPCKGVYIDVYDVLVAFKVTNPASQHAIKKILASGQRGVKDFEQDLLEAIASLNRAIELGEL